MRVLQNHKSKGTYEYEYTWQQDENMIALGEYLITSWNCVGVSSSELSDSSGDDSVLSPSPEVIS